MLVVQEVASLRIVDDELWQRVTMRQENWRAGWYEALCPFGQTTPLFRTLPGIDCWRPSTIIYVEGLTCRFVGPH
jgi:hypothetical protein